MPSTQPLYRHLLCLHHQETKHDPRFAGMLAILGWQPYADYSWDVECGMHIANDPNMQRVTGIIGRTTCPWCLKRPRRTK